MKVAHPEHAAAIGEQRELVRLQLAHARGIGREVAHARDEIAERQAPVADAPEPGVRLLHVFFGDPQVPAVAVDQPSPKVRPSV